MSLADGLARSLRRYLAAKQDHGLEALLLGRVASEDLASQPSDLDPPHGQDAKSYKLKCPSCTADLVFEEGCVKCYGCGYSQC